MRRLIFVLLAATAACAAPSTQVGAVYWKDEVSADQRRADHTSCEVAALQAAPRALSSTPNPTYRVPDNVQCTQVGNYTNCYNYGGQVIGGGTTTTDYNQDLRDRVQDQCMASRGYSLRQFRSCTAEDVKTGVISKSSGIYPRATLVRCLTPDGYVLL